MKSGYKLFWTDHALEELRQTIQYLEQNFTEREIRRLAERIEFTLRLISGNPALFPETRRQKGVRRAVVARYNTLYYRVAGEQIEILSFFSNRQSPDKLKF